MLDRAGFTNREIASRTGAAHETVSRWRSGVQAIGDDDLAVVIEMLRERGISVTRGWIRYGEAPALLEPTVEATPQPARGAKLEEPDVPAPRPSAKKVAEADRKRA